MDVRVVGGGVIGLSIAWRLAQRGLDVTVDYDPRGKHDLPTTVKFLPGIYDWLTHKLAPYSPKP